MKIGIVGAAGRMGRMLTAAVLETEGAELAGGLERDGSDALGQDPAVLAGHAASGLAIGSDAAALFQASDAVIEFALPEATAVHAPLAAEHGTAFVVGTTGHDKDQQQALTEAARSVPVVHAGNMSLGVNLLVGLARQVAASLGPEYDIEVVEMHHRHKVDAPSGTALMLGRAAADGRGVEHDDVAVMSREGHTGPRAEGAIGYATMRGGDVVGEHSIVFAGPGERVELSHKAASRAIFANGAVRAALWCRGKAPGLYSMRDVLGLG